VLLEFRRRSPTYAIRKGRTDMYAILIGMRVPNADDQTGAENKWADILEDL